VSGVNGGYITRVLGREGWELEAKRLEVRSRSLKARDEEKMVLWLKRKRRNKKGEKDRVCF
jgi:hypothetical protein